MDRRNFLVTAGAACAAAAGAKPAAANTDNAKPEEFVGVLVDTTRCIGCRGCEVACAMAHNMPVPDPENYTTYFLKTDGVRYRRKVIPGDTLVFHLHLLTPIRRGIVHMKGVGYVNGQPAVEAEMMAQIARDKVPADTPKPAAKATA